MAREFDIVEAILDLQERVTKLEQAGGSPAAGKDFYSEELNEKIHQALADAGYRTIGDIQQATDEELLAIPGIGPAALRRIREATT